MVLDKTAFGDIYQHYLHLEYNNNATYVPILFDTGAARTSLRYSLLSAGDDWKFFESELISMKIDSTEFSTANGTIKGYLCYIKDISLSNANEQIHFDRLYFYVLPNTVNVLGCDLIEGAVIYKEANGRFNFDLHKNALSAYHLLYAGKRALNVTGLLADRYESVAEFMALLKEAYNERSLR